MIGRRLHPGEAPSDAVRVAAAGRMAEGALQGQEHELTEDALRGSALQLAQDLVLLRRAERREAGPVLFEGQPLQEAEAGDQGAQPGRALFEQAIDVLDSSGLHRPGGSVRWQRRQEAREGRGERQPLARDLVGLLIGRRRHMHTNQPEIVDNVRRHRAGATEPYQEERHEEEQDGHRSVA